METNVILSANNILKLIALVILAGVVFGKISRKVNLPDVVLFILAGVILGPEVLNLINIDSYPVGNQLILTFGAAYILYDGGREIDLKVFNEVKISVLLLSTLGVLISTGITGFFVYKIFHIDFIYALLLGAIISSTDPSVLVPLFKNMNVSNKLKQTIISESAFNDAAAAIVTFAILGVIAGGEFSLGKSIFELLKSSLGGILIGGIFGYISTKLIAGEKYAFLKEFPSEVSIVAVIGTYLIADKLGVSGFMAVFIIGMVCGNKKRINCCIPDEYNQTHLRFKEVLTIILRMMIFVLLGSHIDFGVLSKYFTKDLMVVALLIFVSRPVSAFLSVIFDRKAKWNIKEIIYLMWVRETGVIPAALVGMLLTMHIKNSDIIASVTFTTIIITLTFQASTSKSLAKLLKLDLDEGKKEIAVDSIKI
ncbi:sodium:proton antiporter [Clostridium botulinum]|uniref:Sodium:proton antiporter n=5 Tax=Clostridium TaxID=1485 RepID=A0A0E1QHL4_CLOBO|nr:MULTISPECIES: sodium:proton antiporter [Clostridium]EKX80833.1 transporter, monovalent cation:proton antiporter-2 (CPA2) family protein [Clostridium botulinum CFSAN001628]EPS46335.1 transporter, monovalent cation:proton antiporter-2 (CPA2) family protein [Clostridium botulinum CFSAN002369]EPS46443.1 transporter, monovalent cation:proton antiporter-2 (CPA2) family protein [Clostridium botulinum CFSAN002367]KRU30109.1 sodium:proton antiporter [Clostridium sporogenes]NFK37568.1 sodium:proton a